MQKTIFITGASTGLGKATAQLFQSNGWRVIATMRNPEQGAALAALENVTVLPLDVTNSEQIAQVASKVTALGVDVVFNNAGYGLIGALEALTDEQILKQINTNLLGVMRVTKAFIPYFREHKKGVFITTTSIGGIVGMPLASSYHATKWALEGWSESMSFELNSVGVQIKTVAPGGIKTDFMGRSLDYQAAPEYQSLSDGLFAVAEDMMATASNADQIAAVVYEAATDRKDQVRYVAGEDAKQLYAQRLELGSEAFRKTFGAQFSRK